VFDLPGDCGDPGRVGNYWRAIAPISGSVDPLELLL
jgi:hypothetical protein